MWSLPVSGSVAPCRALIGCCGRWCPNTPGGLKAAPTAPFGQPLSERTPELPTALLPELTSPLAPRPDRRPPSRPRRVPTAAVRCRALTRSEAVDATVYTATPVSASPPPPYLTPSTTLTLSPVPVARHRSSPSHHAADVHARCDTRRRRRAAPSSTLQ
jgi:hypothetical protein